MARLTMVLYQLKCDKCERIVSRHWETPCECGGTLRKIYTAPSPAQEVMNIDTIKNKMEWKQTGSGTAIAMPTLEEAAFLIREIERLTSERDDATDALSLMTEHRDGAAALMKRAQSLVSQRERWGDDAVTVINSAAEIMTIEQLSKWEGSRAVLESTPEPV